MIKTLSLSEPDLEEIDRLLSYCIKHFESPDSPAFLADCASISQELPLYLRQFVSTFRSVESNSQAVLVSGFRIADDALGDSPATWNDPGVKVRTKREEFYISLLSSLFGDIFGWETQQDGVLIHDISPMKTFENEQIGCGSLQEITWHVEDCYSELRADYLALLCLRNPNAAATTISTLDLTTLSDELKNQLSRTVFTIKPDLSICPPGKDQRPPKLISVLEGGMSAPFLRLDPFFMEIPEDREAKEAFESVCEQLTASIRQIALAPGDCLVLDNYKCVHGRRPFKPSYNGKDRWLKRVSISRDLRKARQFLSSSRPRVITDYK